MLPEYALQTVLFSAGAILLVCCKIMPCIICPSERI